jgi:predicted nuclease with TOPRIM domain
MNNQDIDPKEKGAEFWYEAYLKQKQENEELAAKLEAVEKELAELKEKLNKLQGRTSQRFSVGCAKHKDSGYGRIFTIFA